MVPRTQGFVDTRSRLCPPKCLSFSISEQGEQGEHEIWKERLAACRWGHVSASSLSPVRPVHRRAPRVSFVKQIREAADFIRRQPVPVSRSRRPLPEVWPTLVNNLRGRGSPDGGEWIAARDVHEALGISDSAKWTFARYVAELMRAAGWTPSLVGPRHSRRRGYVRFPASSPSEPSQVGPLHHQTVTPRDT